MSSSFVHIQHMDCLLFKANVPLIIFSAFIHGACRWFLILAIVSNVAMNMGVQMPFEILFQLFWIYTQRWNYWIIDMAPPLNVWRSLRTVYRSSNTVSQSPQQCTRGLGSQRAHPCLLFSSFLMVAILTGTR